MKRSIGFLLAGVMTVVPGLALAAGDLSYTYLEADYLNLSIDPYDEEGTLLEDFDDGNGWSIRGSFAVVPNFFIFGGYSQVDAEADFVEDNVVLFTSDRDVKRFTVGGGFNAPIFEGGANQVDIFARAAYMDVDFGDFDFGAGDSEVEDALDDLNNDTSDGYFADAGIRTQLMEWLELSAGARYTSIEDADSLGFIGGALFEISPSFGINLDVEAGGDVSQIFLGVRLSLGR